eukprot:TRINITY_DN1249_c0_g4_i6.p1 TRINITY_DN1249_c0_g4~~TRINITY_DN1249_c0_g4_i6.p1  ORF type:complete len:212 (+),score=8.25 TRINITY_DN1249_c0_g4_i6:1036-1671(+)
MLTARIVPVLADILSPFQIGYMVKKRLHDNVVLLDHILKSKNHAVAFFLDFCKTFDSISHTFLTNIPTAHDFPPFFISVIQFLQSAVSTSIILNQSPIEQLPIQIRRGSRQGDPISGYLFNIAINYLDMLLLHRCKKAGLKLTPLLKIRVLFYCDDTVLVTSSDEDLEQYLFTLNQFSSLWDYLSTGPSAQFSTTYRLNYTVSLFHQLLHI